MIYQTEWIVILCGAATFALRVIPIWNCSRRRVKPQPSGQTLRRFSQGVGPAAIASLLVASLAEQADVFRLMNLAGGLIALSTVFAMKHLCGGIAGPTFAGALVYGLWKYAVS